MKWWTSLHARRFHPLCAEAKCIYTASATNKNYVSSFDAHLKSQHQTQSRDMIKRDVQVGVALRLSQNQFLLTDASRPTGTRSAFAITEFEDLTVQDAAKCLTGSTLAVSTLGYGAAHMTATDNTLESLELLRPATADNGLKSRIREFAGNMLTIQL